MGQDGCGLMPVYWCVVPKRAAHWLVLLNCVFLLAGRLAGLDGAGDGDWTGRLHPTSLLSLPCQSYTHINNVCNPRIPSSHAPLVAPLTFLQSVIVRRRMGG
jgi:hypothetical protein